MKNRAFGALVVIAALIVGGGAARTARAGSSEPVCGRADVLFCDDWEDGDHVGWDWNSGWDSCTQIAGAGGYQSANALKQHIGRDLAECGWPAHEVGRQSVQTAPLYMRWYVKFGSNYQFLDWTDQKNAYFRAVVNDQQTWRMMLGLRARSSSERGQGQIVVDALGHDPRWYFNGDAADPANAGTKYLVPDRWYCIEFAIKGNTPGQSDGWLKVWLDDKTYIVSENQNLKSTGDPITQAPWFSNYYGGNPPGTHPAMDLWYDNVVVARQRIGCTGAVPPTGDTAPPGNVPNVRRTDSRP